MHSSFNRSFFWHRFARAAFRRFVNQPCSCVIKTNDTLDNRQYVQSAAAAHLQCTYGPWISSRIHDWALGAGEARTKQMSLTVLGPGVGQARANEHSRIHHFSPFSLFLRNIFRFEPKLYCKNRIICASFIPRKTFLLCSVFSLTM